MELGSKYAICYYLDGDLWTYTSCEFFPNREAAISHFPYSHPIAYLFRVKLKVA